MLTIEQMQLFNAVWVLAWAMFNTVGILLLFAYPKDGVSKALRLHGVAVTIFLYLTFVTLYFNVVLYPEIRYWLAFVRAVLVIPVLGSGAWLAYILWKVSKK